MRQKYEEGQCVKTVQNADFKYRTRSGIVGRVNDVYYSEKYDEYAYEVEFPGQYELVYQDDLGIGSEE